MIYCIEANWKAYFHIEAQNEQEAKKKLKAMSMTELLEAMDDDAGIRIINVEAAPELTFS